MLPGSGRGIDIVGSFWTWPYTACCSHTDAVNKVQDQGLLGLISDEAFLPVIQMAAFLLNPHLVLGGVGGRELEFSNVSSYKNPVLLD